MKKVFALLLALTVMLGAAAFAEEAGEAIPSPTAGASVISNTGDGVTVIAMPERQLSSMSIPQTRIIIEGEDADELYHRFYLSFMTAGG